MAIDIDTVRRVAHLSRIALPDDQAARMTQELSAILAWVEQLNEVDVDGIEPMTSVEGRALPMREDVVTEGFNAASVLANAPRSEDGFFVVPRSVE